MTGDKWTFLVLRDGGSPVRQYTLSTRALRVAGGVAASFAVILIALAAVVGLDGSARVRAHMLEARNQGLMAELAQFQKRVAGLESTLGTMARKDDRFRNLAGLDGIDAEVLEVGVGGPGLGTPESYPLWQVDSVAGKTAFAISYDLNALERRARLLSESLDEATDSLKAHYDLLESTPSILPTTGWLSSRFSKSRMHPIHNRPLPHEGIDIAAPDGTPILAAAKGRVIRSGWVVGYGLTVEIDHGFGYTTLYGHASKLLVRRGQLVKRGDVIAKVGRTGVATSSNLHYEVRIHGKPVNPLNFVLPASVP